MQKHCILPILLRMDQTKNQAAQTTLRLKKTLATEQGSFLSMIFPATSIYSYISPVMELVHGNPIHSPHFPNKIPPK